MKRKSIIHSLIAATLSLVVVFSAGCKDDNTTENPSTSVSYALSFDDLALLNGQSISLDAVLLMDGALTEGAITYESSDSSIVSINGATATANKLGSVTITATATKDDVKVTKTVNCTVGIDAGIVPDEHEYTLYISDNVHGVAYETQRTIAADVYGGGEKIDGAEVTWTCADSSVATVSEDGHMQAVKVGETYVVGTYTDDTYGELKTVQIPLKVEIPVLSTQMNVVLDITESASQIDANTILGNGKIAGKMRNVDTGKEIAVENGAVSTNGLKVGEYRYVFYDKNDKMGCEVNVVVADYVINDKTDFMNLGANYDARYVALNTDLKNVGKYMNDPGVNSGEFTGIFNGLGHKIEGLEIASNGTGLFAHLGNGATFKNVSFSKAVVNASNAGIFCYRTTGVVTIDNVYLQVDSILSSAWYTGVAYGFCYNGRVDISNTIIVSDGLSGGDVRLYNGALCGRSATLPLCKNVYVISEGLLCGTGEHVKNIVYAEINNYSIIYKTKSDFVADRYSELTSIDLSTFNAQYWDTTKDVPCFK